MIRAVWDSLIIKPKSVESTKRSFYVPDMGSEISITGEVIDVGPGRWDASGTNRIPMSFKVGDTVIIPKIGPTKLEWDGEEYWGISEANVLAIIENENK